jgi:hypothetical protein
MNRIEVFSQRGSGNIENVFFKIDDNHLKIPFEKNYNGSFNIRYVLEFAEYEATYHEKLLGTKMETFIISDVLINKDSNIILINEQNSFKQQIKNVLSTNFYNIQCEIYIDTPIHAYHFLNAIPLPTNILTFYFLIYHQAHIKRSINFETQALYDGYNHIGFFITDLTRMKDVISKMYNNKKLDLVKEFTSTDLVDKLFEEGIFIIVWGINPYAYPIFSSNDINALTPLLGQESSFKGIYKINSKIDRLNLIPGHKLSEWPKFLNESFPLIRLYGNGERVIVKVFQLKDNDSEITIPSFLLVRDEGIVNETSPLMNINLFD